MGYSQSDIYSLFHGTLFFFFLLFFFGNTAVASISHQPVHATLAMLLQFCSSTWDSKCIKSIQSFVNTLASLDRDMKVCVLAEYVHNSIRATCMQRTVRCS